MCIYYSTFTCVMMILLLFGVGLNVSRSLNSQMFYFSDHHFQQPWVPPTLPHVFPQRPGVKRGHPKLDSRFVSDVTIMDGTVMAPSTPFTKIWRMRNNGSFIWVSGTRLVWIGGDNFSEKHTVEIEVPSVQYIAALRKCQKIDAALS